MLVYIAVISGVICISEGLVPTLQYAVLMFFLFVVPWFAYSFLRAIRFSVFTPSPLAEFLDEIVTTGQDLRKPLYVTLSDYQLGFDPDKPRLFYGKDFDKVIWGAVEYEYEYPNYFKVNDLSLGEQKDLLLGSAALPLGIFPPIHMGPREYVDGGVADNLPLYPLVSLEKCDELFVIPLRPTRVDSLKSHWQEIDRRLRRRKISVDQGKELYYSELDKREGDYKHAPHYEPPVNLPLRQPETWPTRIVIISPRRHLGTFLTGTMNFRSRYAKRLMKQGYRDALTAIEEQLFCSTD